MRQYVLSIAKRRGYEHRRDSFGNVVVRKPASAGHDASPVSILQSHLDMVQEKNKAKLFDFSKDAIVPLRDGEHLTADGTTLGADNGIGVAAMLAVLESTEIVHGPLELLFTVEEETGLNGAKELDASLLAGRRLINLDSEQERIVYIGCAGGGNVKISFDAGSAETSDGDCAVSVGLGGLKGGHSGCDIHLQRGNAISLLARVLWRALRIAEGPPAFRIARLEGGSADNAIPREASATVIVSVSDRSRVEDDIRAEFAKIRSHYRRTDPDIALVVRDEDKEEEVQCSGDERTTLKALGLVLSLPHGVEAMSHTVRNLVETSNNVAMVKGVRGSLVITTSSRSSVNSELDALRRRIRSTAELAGAAVDLCPTSEYPAWDPNPDSKILDIVERVHARELGSPPEISGIHAGLECAVIGDKVPGIDMISFGPVIDFPHSPDERVLIPSVERFWRLLNATLAELA